jgi:hypothetical protein
MMAPYNHIINDKTGVPIPVPRGSPQGPNQWFYGAPVVLARFPIYVTPLTVLARTLFVNILSLETTPAVRLCGILMILTILILLKDFEHHIDTILFCIIVLCYDL